MSIAASIPAAIVDLFVGFLLPLLLPASGGDPGTARATALHLLAELRPQSGRELKLAAESVGLGLKGLAMLAKSAESGASAEAQADAVKWACSLSRGSHQAQRRLDELQRPRRVTRQQADADDAALPLAEALSAIGALMTPAVPQADTAPPPAPDSAPQPVLSATAPPEPAAAAPAPNTEAEPAQPEAATAAPDPAAEVAAAALALDSAERLLSVMRAYHKGAPPPHSKAAQDIQAQRRVVDMARLKLQQTRRRAAMVATQAAPSHAA